MSRNAGARAGAVLVCGALALQLGLGRAAGAGDGGNELRRLAAGLAAQLAEDFPVLEGVVIGTDGRSLVVELGAAPRVPGAGVEIYRLEDGEGQVRSARRIAVGRLLDVGTSRARVQIESAEAEVVPGDRLRSAAEVVGIGVVPSTEPGERRALAELLAVRVAHELNMHGRFRAEVLGGRGAPGEAWVASESAVRGYLWRGLRYTLHLKYVEDGAHGTLIGRLYSLLERETVDLVSTRQPLGPQWGALLAALAERDPVSAAAVEHRRSAVGYRAVAVLPVRAAEGPALAVLGRSSVHVLSPQGNELREERTVPLPAELQLGAAARDYFGVLLAEPTGRLRAGHSLLRQGVTLELGTGRVEPSAPEMWLGAEPWPLTASYRPGSNLLLALRVGDRPVAPELEELRFAGWIRPGQLLVQRRDYRLLLLDPAQGTQRELTALLGAGVSVLALPSPLLAATEPAVVDGAAGAPADRITLYRLDGTSLQPVWRSEPIGGALSSTGMALIDGRVHLGAVELMPQGSRLHLYSGIAVP
jgi:hypothetical protein